MQHGDRLGCGRRVREDRQPVVVRVGCERDRVGTFHVAVAVPDRTPAFRPAPVTVSDQQVCAVVQRPVQGGGVRGQRGGVEDGPIPGHHLGQQSRGRGVHEPLAVPADQQRSHGRRRPHDRLGVPDPEDGQRRWRGGVRGRSQGGLVVEGNLRGVGHRRPIATWGVQARRQRIGEQLPGRYGPRRAEPLVLQVAAQHHVADTHQPGGVGERVGFEHPLLQPAVQRAQQVGGCGGAERDQFAGQEGAVGESGQDGVESRAPAVVGEVRPGQFQDPGARPRRVQSGGDLSFVGGDRLGTVQPGLDEPAAPQRAQVRHDQHDHDRPRDTRHRARQPGSRSAQAGQAGREPAPAVRCRLCALCEVLFDALRDRREPAGQQHRQTEGDQRHGTGHRAQGEAGGGRLGERPEGRTQRRGVVVGVDPDRHRGTDEYEQDKVRPVSPPTQRGAGQGQQRHREADDDHPDGLGVVPRRRDPGTEHVPAVEVPVAQAAQYLGCLGGARDRPERLAVGEDVDAVAGLGNQTRDPPCRAAHDRHRGSGAHSQRGAQPDLAGSPHGEGQPQDRRQQHEDQTGGVAAADQGDGDAERRRPAPAVQPPAGKPPHRLAQAPDRDPQQPAQTRVRQQDRRHPRLIFQDVRGQHVARGGDEGEPVRPAERPHAEQHARTGHEQHRAGPQPLGDPGG